MTVIEEALFTGCINELKVRLDAIYGQSCRSSDFLAEILDVLEHTDFLSTN